MTDGERWAHETLAALRAGRFTPRAWIAFLAASLVRARLQRHAHARAHRQTLALGLIVMAAWAGVVFTGRPWLGLAGATWWLLLVLMVDWHLGMLQRDDGTRLSGLGTANAITMLRGALVPVLPALAATELLVVLATATALDVADGRLARRRDEATRLGAWLDGSLDTITAATVAVSAARLGAVPWWLAALVLARVALPWALLGTAYLVRPEWKQAGYDSRMPGLAARLPGAAAALGIGLALAGLEVGVVVAAGGIAVSMLTFLGPSAQRTRRPATATRA